MPLASIALVVGSALCFSTLDSIVKSLAPRYPIPLLVWARWTMQVLVIAAWLAPREGPSFVRTRHPRGHLVRGALLIGSSLCFVYALREMPLAAVTALNYSTPMMVVVLAVIIGSLLGVMWVLAVTRGSPR